MDDQVQRLVNKVWDKFLQTSPDRRLMIGIGGIPGSGKTTLSLTLTKALNARHATEQPTQKATPVAAFVPMDGYHYTRAQLSAMPDPAHAHARRGAEFTFDGAAFLALVQRLREPLPSTAARPPSTTTTTTVPTSASTTSNPEDDPPASFPPGTIHAPSFSHALKDPVPNALPLLPSHRILVFEGNYLALDRAPWRDAAALMDEVWFVEVDFAVARTRLAARHVAAGLAATLAEGDRRAVENDLPNGEEIMRLRGRVDEVVVSREDGSWAGGQ